MPNRDVAQLLREVSELRDAVHAEADATLVRWSPWIARPEFLPSAVNFAHYLALRRHDVRGLQRRLMGFGLSSLGRAESRVLPTLEAVQRVLRVLNGQDGQAEASLAMDPAFFAGESRIASRANEMLGPCSNRRPVQLMVTLPSEAADDAAFVLRLDELGVEAVRINCAHDDADAWRRMIGHVDQAAERTGRRMKVLMDLAGPKIRTGEVRDVRHLTRVKVGDLLAITLPGQLADADATLAAVECTLPEALSAAGAGQQIFLDDGRLDMRVERREPWGVAARIVAGPDEDGYKLKREKGINFPETDFSVPALTAEDRDALPFVARHADGIEFSFVQTGSDVVMLHEALARLRPDDWQRLSLVLKIETARAVRNLPDMLVRAAGRQPTAVMIARGDLAVEIGFARLAEMQEEILWLGEAAQVPVIWATQVLETFLKKGVPSRGEMTDAAMAVRAECVMLNKGPHLFEAIGELDRLLSRMGEHVHKKTSQLRPLRSWSATDPDGTPAGGTGTLVG